MFEVEVGGKVIAKAVEWRYALVGAIKELKSDDASISELLSRYTLVNDYDFNYSSSKSSYDSWLKKNRSKATTNTASTKGPCGWCDYCGAKPQPEIGFEGCPITAFIGCMQKSTFMRPENWVDPKASKAN